MKIKSFLLFLLPTCMLVMSIHAIDSQNDNKIDSLLNLIESDNADTNYVIHLNELVNEYIIRNEYNEGLKYAEKSVALSNALFIDNKRGWPKGMVVAYNNLGTIYMNIGNYSEALKNYLLGIKANETVKDKRYTAELYNRIGRVYLMQGNYTEAFKNQNVSLKMYEEMNYQEGIANVYNDIGSGYYMQGNYPEALKNYFISLRRIKDEKILATVYNNIGNIYQLQSNFSESIKNNRMAIKIRQKINDQRGIADSYNNIGNIYFAQGNYADALENHFFSLNIRKELKDPQRIAMSYTNIGNAYVMRTNYQEALKNYLAALELNEKLNDKVNTAICFANLGDVQAKLNSYKSAQNYLDQALTISRDIGYKELIKVCYETLSILDSTQGKWKDAYIHYKLLTLYKDSINNEESRKKILESALAYKYEKKELETKASQDKKDAMAALEKRKQKIIFTIVAIAFLLVLVFTVFLIRALRTTKKQKNIIEQQKAFKEQFLANMSHEIRSPMNAILGMTNLMLHTSITPKQEQYLTAVKRSSESLLVIINDVLDLSKLEAGKMELEKIPFRLDVLIQQVYFCMQFKAEEKGLGLITQIDPEVPPVLVGDPHRLNQILINLAGNAIKFTTKGEVKVIVETERNSTNLIKFRVIDTGIGIPKDKIDLLFKNFSQVDSSITRKYGGTGLGLAISKNLIELHNGKIEVKSEEGVGSEFFFVIPLEASAEITIETEQISDYTVLTGIKILVAEDNEYNQIVVQDTLESLIKDVSVDIAGNGEIAIKKHLENEYDIILMDVQMPNMSGIEAVQYIRAKLDGAKQKIPILALTASITEKDIKECLVVGMNGWIPKPFKREELLNALAKHFRRKQEIVYESKPMDKKDEKKYEIKILQEEHNVTDLAFLKEFCNSDEARMKKYITMYLKDIEEQLKKIEYTYKEQDYSSLSRIAHTIKSQFKYMGMSRAKEISEIIENHAGENINPEQLPEMIVQLNDVCKKSIEELSRFKQ